MSASSESYEPMPTGAGTNTPRSTSTDASRGRRRDRRSRASSRSHSRSFSRSTSYSSSYPSSASPPPSRSASTLASTTPTPRSTATRSTAAAARRASRRSSASPPHSRAATVAAGDADSTHTPQPPAQARRRPHGGRREGGNAAAPPQGKRRNGSRGGTRRLSQTHAGGTRTTGRPRKGLLYDELPEEIRAPRGRYAYPEPLTPFPPLLAHPQERRASVDMKRRHVMKMSAKNAGFKVKPQMVLEGEDALLLQHTVEWEATMRMTLEWEEVKELRRLEVVWAKHDEKRIRDIRTALEAHEREEEIAAVRLDRDAAKIMECEYTMRHRVEKQERKSREGMAKAWERAVMQHLVHAEVLIRHSNRRKTKAIVEFLRGEGHERNDIATEEKLARVAVQRTIGKTITQFKHDELVKKVREHKQQQILKAQASRVDLRRMGGASTGLSLRSQTPASLPPLPQNTPSMQSSVRAPRVPYRSVSELRGEHDVERWDALFATLVNKEDHHRERVDCQRDSDFGVIIFKHDRAVELFYEQARRAQVAYIKEVQAAGDAAMTACVQAEGDQRAKIEKAAVEGHQSIVRHELREGVRRRRHEESVVKREGIHKRKIAAQRGRAAREQEDYVETTRAISQQHNLVLAEHRSREAIAQQHEARIRKFKALELSAAVTAVLVHETRVRKKALKSEGAARGDLKVKFKQEGFYVENCTMSLDSLVQRHAKAVRHQYQAQVNHVLALEGVERGVVDKEEDGARGLLTKISKAESIDAHNRAAAAVERRGQCHESLKQNKKAQAAVKASQAAAAAGRIREAHQQDRNALARAEHQVRGAVRAEERHAFTALYLQHQRANPQRGKRSGETAEKGGGAKEKQKKTDEQRGSPTAPASQAGTPASPGSVKSTTGGGHPRKHEKQYAVYENSVAPVRGRGGGSPTRSPAAQSLKAKSPEAGASMEPAASPETNTAAPPAATATAHESASAAKIQAVYRGKRARDAYAARKSDRRAAAAATAAETPTAAAEDDDDYDDEDYDDDFV